MALHFSRQEFDARRDRLLIEMKAKKLDAILLFAQESMYWLTGYDTFGFCFFQCLVVKRDGTVVLLTRSADLRQAKHTSTIENVTVWTDRENANPALDLRNLLNDLDLLGSRIGVEYDTHGLTGKTGRMLDEQLATFGEIADAFQLRRHVGEVVRRAGSGPAADPPRRRRGGDPGGHAGRGVRGRRRLSRQRVHHRFRRRRASMPLQSGAPETLRERSAYPGMGRRVPPLPRRHDAHGDRRRAFRPPRRAFRGRARRAACRGSRDGAGKDVRRRVRRACPHHGGAYPEPPPAQRLRLLARRPLHARPGWTCRCSTRTIRRPSRRT